MNKRLFVLLIGLMSFSLIGIIGVQYYWISDAYRTKQEQFTINARSVIRSVADKIRYKEIENVYNLYSPQFDTITIPDNVSITTLQFLTRNSETNETHIFTDGLLEQDYKFSPNIFDIGQDTIFFKKLTNKRTKSTISTGLDGHSVLQTKEESSERMQDFEKKQFENFIRDIAGLLPIYKRISAEEIRSLLEEGLKDAGLKTDFEFAVHSHQIQTKVRSANFEPHEESTYFVSLFPNDRNTNYELYVDFPDKRKILRNEVFGIAVLSLVFTTIIILAYGGAIQQIYKQRQISQIKTDFINNMTHEFKTPIATINLALDSLKNPKVKDNREFLERYLQMIRDENKRMHAQVENVLRISKLEKNELDLPKEVVDLKEITEEAINHLLLIVENEGGYIKTHFGALRNTVLANRSHMTNVIVNILDNAIKYSESEPKIDVYTENVKDSILLKIRDQGPGMSKNVQKRIFEKFYREHTGDIHNVKGHGLGLAYVKSIIDDHGAEIYVESEKGKGSTFIIKLHLIS